MNGLIILLIFILIVLLILYFSLERQPKEENNLEKLPTLEQRLETIEECGTELYQCQEVIEFTKRGIQTFQNNPIDRWQKLAEENIDHRFGLYWFVIDMNGVEFVLGATPNYQANNISDLQDETGKYITREILAKAKAGGGWVTYYWYIDPETEPGLPEDELVKEKHSYVVPFTYQGRQYVIGTGIYLSPAIAELNQVCQADSTIEHCPSDLFPNCKRVMERVNTVSNLFRDFSTKRAIEILKEQRENFTNEELYIYVNNFAGDVLFNSLNPAAEGTNVADSPCFQAALEKLELCTAGWNRCTFGETESQGYDVDVSDCSTCQAKDRIIVGSSFNLPETTTEKGENS